MNESEPVVVGVDGSESALHAVRWATEEFCAVGLGSGWSMCASRGPAYPSSILARSVMR